MVDKPNLDPYIYGFLAGVVRSKYGNTLSEEEIAQTTRKAYMKFSEFLLQEFRNLSQINADQNDRLKTIYQTEPNRIELLNFLDTIVRGNTGSSLDKVLITILNSFVEKFRDEF